MAVTLAFQPTPFVGREAELSRLLTLLEQPDSRLITILGAGGVGKTRLALATAESAAQRNELPVLSVSIDAPHSREQLSAAVANAIGCNWYKDEAVETQLLAWMKEKRLLLLLDNFEYAQDGADFIMTLLNAGPEIRVLVTSRERVGLRGEMAFALSGFSTSVWQSVEEASGSPAVRLFLNAAQRARADFELGDTNLTHICRICRIVEGLPLAIELAAAWVDTLSVKEIADEIEQSYQFLSSDFRDLPERHRSMAATFEASWKCLSADKQDSLMRMSIFRGGFTRSAALAITGASVYTLQALVNKSLLKYMDDEHYAIHELLRQYLSDKLKESSQLDRVQAAHSRYFLDWLHTVDPLIKGRDQRDILDRIDRDFANVRLAWENALDRRDYPALDGALESLFWFCMMRAHYYAGEQLIERVQSFKAENDDVRLLQARARLRRSWIERWRRGAFNEEAVVPQLEAMLRLFQQTRRQHDTAVCLLVLGDASRYFGEHSEDARQYLSRSLELLGDLNDNFYAAWALHFMGRDALMTEGLARAVQFQQESLNLRERCGDLNGVLYAQFNLADYFLQMGDFDRSTALARSMLERSRETSERSSELMAMALLSIIAFLRADLQTAADLSAQALSTAMNLNHLLGRTYAILVDNLNATVRGNPRDAARHLRALEPAGLHSVVRYWVNLASAMAQVSSEEPGLARDTIRKALSYACTVQGVGVMGWCLPICAVIAAQEGDLSRAAYLVGLSDKIDLARWSNIWSVFTDLRAALVSKLGADAYDYHIEEGQKLDLAGTIEMLLQAASTDLAGNLLFAPQMVSANRALEEPLSDRELEVLAWIARGLQNAEIADQLVVEMSTIKKHVSHVYGKLGVTTRAQAILKAQQLGLV